jgi:hypothetical protein
MSFMALANVFIGANQTQGWSATWPSPRWPEWPGIVLVQAQPVTDVALICSTPSVSSAPSGEYSFLLRSRTAVRPLVGTIFTWKAACREAMKVSRMKLELTYDADGEILTLFDPEKLRSENVSLRYVPAPGERHEVIELPKEFEAELFSDLPKVLRVNAEGSTPKFERK